MKIEIIDKEKSTEDNYVILEGIVEVPAQMFRNNQLLKSIILPNSVRVINSEAFAYCKSLTNINIPNSVTNIGEGAFRCCTSLSTIEIPNSITCIKADTFKGCTSLENIKIPDSVNSINESAFDFCVSLHNINIADFRFVSIESKFIEYYKTLFKKDLCNWFEIDIQTNGEFKYIFIPSAEGSLQFQRPSSRCSDSTFHEYCFSIACFYTDLIPQVISKVTNNSDGKYLFAQSSGWPIISCGMGGIMSPAQVLKEAKLEPYPEERDKYYPMLQMLLRFFQNEVKDFLQGTALNLDNKSYTRLCELSNGKVNAILSEIEVQTANYVSFLKGEIDHFEMYMLNDYQLYGK